LPSNFDAKPQQINLIPFDITVFVASQFIGAGFVEDKLI
jgi:hypothetical protein